MENAKAMRRGKMTSDEDEVPTQLGTQSDAKEKSSYSRPAVELEDDDADASTTLNDSH